MFHSYCIDLYMQSQITCPSCKNDWIESQRFNNICLDGNGLNSEEDEHIEEDINVPGPSRRRGR